MTVITQAQLQIQHFNFSIKSVSKLHVWISPGQQRVDNSVQVARSFYIELGNLVLWGQCHVAGFDLIHITMM
jgi:hypothetical protein